MFVGQSARIVIVDDEKYIGQIIDEALVNEDYAVATFCEPGEALNYIQSNKVDLVLTDLVMGEYSGVQILDTTLTNHHDAIVILMTAHPTVQVAISVLKRGAYDFLVKPFKLELLKATIKRGLAHQKVVRENLTLKGQVQFLRVANSGSAASDLENYLVQVLRSCRTELSAVGASIMQLDPADGLVMRRLYNTDDAQHMDVLMDEGPLEALRTVATEVPLIVSDQSTINSQPMCRMIITQPIFIGAELHGMIRLVVVSRFDQITPGQLDALTILANSAGSAITHQKLYDDLKKSYLQAIRAMANAIEARDQYTAGHTDRVIILAELMARELGWDGDRLYNLVMGCTLHDIGKIGVPDSILNKQGPLTPEERERMIRHPFDGLKIIGNIDLFRPSVPYIIAHHERYDGAGYPKGLKGEEIPIEGRLLAVVDTFDAIISDRPYRTGAPIEVAVDELLRNRGTQFDPELVDLFIGLLMKRKIDFKRIYGREENLDFLVESTAVNSEKARV